MSTETLDVPCPYFDAPPGVSCRAVDGVRWAPHLVRRMAAERRLQRCDGCGTIGWRADGPEPEPLTIACSACLADPGEPCHATSTNEPRLHPHRLRALGAAETLRRCPDCGGRGWRETRREDR